MKKLLAVMLSLILAVLFLITVVAILYGIGYVLYHYWAFVILAACLIGLTTGFYDDVLDLIERWGMK